MTEERTGWRLGGREKRFLLCLAIVLAVAAWKFIPRPWKPALTLQTDHFSIASTASPEQTEETGRRVVEMLYAAYSNRFSGLPSFQQSHPKLRLRLYRDREEIRRVNRDMGWAEAFYRKPTCHAY